MILYSMPLNFQPKISTEKNQRRNRKDKEHSVNEITLFNARNLELNVEKNSISRFERFDLFFLFILLNKCDKIK